MTQSTEPNEKEAAAVPEKCPICGDPIFSNGAYAFAMYRCGSDVKNEYQSFRQSDRCRRKELEQTVAKLTAENSANESAIIRLLSEKETITAERDKLQVFKDWVHNWLDNYGVPHDPNPKRTAETGCRISNRMEWLKAGRDAPVAERGLLNHCLDSVREISIITLPGSLGYLYRRSTGDWCHPDTSTTAIYTTALDAIRAALKAKDDGDAELDAAGDKP